MTHSGFYQQYYFKVQHYYYTQQYYQFLVDMQSFAQIRKNRMTNIRASLQEIPIIKKNSISIQHKIAKRCQSLKDKVEGETDLIHKNQEETSCMNDQISIGKFQEKYELGQKIGEGSNGFVKKCFVRSTRELFAVKSISMDQEHIMFLKSNFKYIKELDHPNIIRYHFMYLDNKKKVCYLVMDYDSHPCLLDYNDLSEDQIRQIMFQLLSTLAYIHSKSICHRDIKPENILYDRQNKKIKLIDFGISKKLENRGYKKDMLTITGTLYYRAPQMFLGGGYDQKVDVWAAGVTLYQLLSKKRTPFESDFLSTTIDNIIKGQVQYPDQVWNQYNKFAKDLVSRMLKNREQRLTASEAKKHFWFQQNSNQSIDLTRSDNIKLAFQFKKYSVVQSFDEQYKFERSLTNRFSSIKQSGEITKKIEKGKNVLKKWLAEGSDDDVLIDVQSEEDNGEESIAIQTKN